MKKVLKIIGIGFICGIFLLFIQRFFSIPEDIFLKYYYVIGFSVIILTVLFNVLYNLSYCKKINKAIVLFKNGRPKEYIDQMERIKEKAKGRALRRLIDINLGAGYYDLKQYDKAIALLEPLSKEKLRGALQIVCLLNLCLSYFRAQENKKAMALYDQSKNKFDKFKSMGKYAENIILLEIFVALEKGEPTRAEELVITLEKQVTDERVKNELSNLIENSTYFSFKCL